MVKASSNTMRVFSVVWFGQFISLIGSGLTNFGLGVWVFQQTGSATLFGLISLCAVLPGIVLSPIAGSVADRWDRRKTMILSDCGSGLATLTVALLLLSGNLELWHIYIAVAFSSAAGAFQWPAYAAATTQLVPEEQLGRANGMVQLGQAGSQLIAPLLAGILIATIQLEGVMLIDFATFLFSMVTLLAVRFPKLVRKDEAEANQSSLLRDASYGWKYVRSQTGLMELMIFFALGNLLVGMVSVLVTPLILGFASTTALGTVLSVGGSGMIVGSILLSAWGGFKRRIDTVLGFFFICGLGLVLAGLQPSVPLVTCAAFIFFFSLPFVNGSTNAIIQSKVEESAQGRVFAVLQMIATSAVPIAYLVAGPLADQLFNPLLRTDGELAGTIGYIIGVGEGRGIGLMFIVMGMLLCLLTIAGALYSPLRNVEGPVPTQADELAANRKVEGHTANVAQVSPLDNP